MEQLWNSTGSAFSYAHGWVNSLLGDSIGSSGWDVLIKGNFLRIWTPQCIPPVFSSILFLPIGRIRRISSLESKQGCKQTLVQDVWCFEVLIVCRDLICNTRETNIPKWHSIELHMNLLVHAYLSVFCRFGWLSLCMTAFASFLNIFSHIILATFEHSSAVRTPYARDQLILVRICGY